MTHILYNTRRKKRRIARFQQFVDPTGVYYSGFGLFHLGILDEEQWIKLSLRRQRAASAGLNIYDYCTPRKHNNPSRLP